MDSRFVLIHSPLVGPLTWSLIAAELHQRGIETVVPTLDDTEDSGRSYWQQHADSVARWLTAVPSDRPLVLVGHSGAGPLLPTIRQHIGHPIGAYLFVDAGLPAGGKSRLDEMESNAPDFAKQLRQHLASGGRFPTWSDEQLREIIPDDQLRRAMVAGLRPRPLAFFEESIPVFTGWPDAPCGYLLFSTPYRSATEQAEQAGWAFRELAAGHFHMLVDPSAVTTALVELVNECQAASR